MPDGGWHEPGGPVFGPDGLIYFAQGSVAQQGIIEAAGFTVDIARHPDAQDVPGQDITLTGTSGAMTLSFRTPTTYRPVRSNHTEFPRRKGEHIKGELWCSTGVYRARPDGTEPELLAWGIRNPYGLVFNEEGELYASDNDYEEKGSRAVGEDSDRIWHIKNASKPHGNISAPDWYGFPTTPAIVFRFGTLSMPRIAAYRQKQQIENPPPLAGPAAVLF